MHMKTSPKVVIIGAGAIGSAIAYLLKSKKITPLMWDIDPAKVRAHRKLEDVLPDADVVFFCVPSWAMRSALSHAAPHISKQSIAVLLAKGIESKTRLTMDALIASVLPRQPFALLDGPMLAKEIMQGKGAGAVVATKQKKTATSIQSLFAGTSLAIETSTDVRGAALASVLKNIYAIGFGIADGLNCGANHRGMLAMRAIQEMRGIVTCLGGRAETVLGPAGLGDLVATGLSPYSVNHTLGVALAKNGKSTIQSEGRSSLPHLVAMLGRNYTGYHVLNALVRVLLNGQPAKIFRTIVR